MKPIFRRRAKASLLVMAPVVTALVVMALVVMALVVAAGEQTLCRLATRTLVVKHMHQTALECEERAESDSCSWYDEVKHHNLPYECTAFRWA